MNSWIKAIVLLVLFGLFTIPLHAQTQPQSTDTAKVAAAADTALKGSGLVNLNDEIELMEIQIEAVIEKPSVAILPKRMEPELGEVEFVNRSFEKELKQVPEKPMIIDNRLWGPKKVEDFKAKLIGSKKSSK